MSKEDAKEKLPLEYQAMIDKDDTWKNRIEVILLAILDELQKKAG